MALVIGALTSITTPAVVGILIPVLGLEPMLTVVAVVAVTGVLVLALVSRRSAAKCDGPAGGRVPRRR